MNDTPNTNAAELPHILTATDIGAMTPLVNKHFLNANAIRRQKSLGDATGLKNVGFHIVEVDPGFESTEYHRHHYEEECVYVLAGEATVTLGEAQHVLHAGDFIGYPIDGIAHTMKNTGADILKCIVVGQRLAQDISDYPRQQKKLYRNSGCWELVDDAVINTVKTKPLK